MLLKNNLYHILSANGTEYTIRLNPSHPVFAGHFPGYPVVPGACLVQIAQELVSDRVGRPVHFTELRNLKFKQPITPVMEIRYTIQGNKISISSLDSTEYAQFAATYMCSDSDV